MSRKPYKPVRITTMQAEFAAECIAMRRKYPSLRKLAQQWYMDEATIRRAIKRLALSVD